MKGDEILTARLTNQHLIGPGLEEPAQLVSHLGAVQSQDYAAAKWALALRLGTTSDAQIEQALADGKILRTHVLRPTWHFVAPADVRWMLALSGAKIRAQMAPYARSLGLGEEVFATANTVLARALEGGRSLTRPELGAALRAGGLEIPDPARVSNILSRAEIDGVVTSGPPRGRVQTHALLAERAPDAIVLQRDEALAELTWRYFNSHGPALVQDCSWWSGLSVGEVRRGVELNGPRLRSTEFDGRTYWSGDTCELDLAEARSTAHLLPNYDEYTVAYRERDLYYDRVANATGNPRDDVPFRDVIVACGRVAGRWKRMPGGAIEHAWTISPSARLEGSLADAARRYAEFVSPRCAS
jgi:hypothetical protein